jgi:multiple sugar transport system substrate-binding protein
LGAVGGLAAAAAVGWGLAGYLASKPKAPAVEKTVTLTKTVTATPAVTTPATTPLAPVTLNLQCQDDPYNFAFPPIMESFKKELGITINKTVLGYSAHHEKTMVDFVSHTGLNDIYSIDAVWCGEYYPYVVDLKQFLPDLKAAGVPLDDIPKAMLDLGYSKMGPEEKLVCLPLQPHNILTIYREDLFEKEGLAFKDPLHPTLEEVMAFAETLNNPGKGFYGWSTRCQSGAAMGQEFLQMITAFGGRVFDKDFYPHLDSPQAMSAMAWLVDMKKYAPPDLPVLAWDETLATIQLGRVAISSEWYARVRWAEDPTKSKVAGKLGYGIYPHAEKNTDFQENTGMWGIGINADSKHVREAWEFIKYLYVHNKEFVLAGSTPSRISVFMDPEMEKTYPWWVKAREAALETWKRGFSWGRPPIPEFDWLQTHGGDVCNAILVGKLDLEKGLKTLNEDFRKKLEEAGYYKKGINPLPDWYFEHYTPATYP